MLASTFGENELFKALSRAGIKDSLFTEQFEGVRIRVEEMVGLRITRLRIALPERVQAQGSAAE